jgi:hypothetical protein
MKNILSVFVSIFISASIIYSCGEKKDTLKEVRASDDSGHTDSVHVFDIPELLDLNINMIKRSLGKPVTNFQPDEEQKLMQILPVIEYKKGTTMIFIEYDSVDVNKIFISDNFKERTVEDIMKLGKIELNNPDYNVKVTEWKRRSLENSDTLSLSGIEVSKK